MSGENRQLFTNEPVEVQDCRKINDHFRGIYRILYPNYLVKENQGLSTFNRLDLQTLGSQVLNLLSYAQKMTPITGFNLQISTESTVRLSISSLGLM